MGDRPQKIRERMVTRTTLGFATEERRWSLGEGGAQSAYLASTSSLAPQDAPFSSNTESPPPSAWPSAAIFGGERPFWLRKAPEWVHGSAKGPTGEDQCPRRVQTKRLFFQKEATGGTEASPPPPRSGPALSGLFRVSPPGFPAGAGAPRSRSTCRTGHRRGAQVLVSASHRLFGDFLKDRCSIPVNRGVAEHLPSVPQLAQRRPIWRPTEGKAGEVSDDAGRPSIKREQAEPSLPEQNARRMALRRGTCSRKRDHLLLVPFGSASTDESRTEPGPRPSLADTEQRDPAGPVLSTRETPSVDRLF